MNKSVFRQPDSWLSFRSNIEYNRIVRFYIHFVILVLEDHPIYTPRTAHALQASPEINYVDHCRQYCVFCVDDSTVASDIVVDTWATFLKCVLSEKGPYESKRLRRKLPKLLSYALDLALCILTPSPSLCGKNPCCAPFPYCKKSQHCMWHGSNFVVCRVGILWYCSHMALLGVQTFGCVREGEQLKHMPDSCGQLVRYVLMGGNIHVLI